MTNGNTTEPINAAEVAAAHDAMAGEYDDLHDLWYPWLFARIHELIAANLPRVQGRQLAALDAGCGTGFQSFLLAQAGAQVEGFDIAENLLTIARAKAACMATSVRSGSAPPFFRVRAPQTWLGEHERRLTQWLEAARAGRTVAPPVFTFADIREYAFKENTLDVIVCCGSVLSFVDSYGEVIARMARALRPGGRLFLEVEQKTNLDLCWPLIDRLLGGVFEYEQGWAKSWGNLVAPSKHSRQVDYPFELSDGRQLTLPITLFSVRELAALFRHNRLRVVDCVGIHAVTNLIPSTVLHGSSPGPALRGFFEVLRRIEARIGRRWPFWRLGCSVAYCLEKAP